jgi:hypothetical protein
MFLRYECKNKMQAMDIKFLWSIDHKPSRDRVRNESLETLEFKICEQNYKRDNYSHLTV